MAGFSYSGDDGYPMVDLDSDLEQGFDSSEDEVDVILHGTPEQKRRLRRRSLALDSSSDDDFEKEMEAELNQTMKNLKRNNKDVSDATDGKQTGESSRKKTKESSFYDKVYFDSDSDEELTSKEKANVSHGVISNDDLFYDPKIDDENQKWVDDKRRQYQPNSNHVSSGHTDSNSLPKGNLSDQQQPLPHSDAVLNCPACMTVLCLDCQRHDVYKNQYRAMFVMNCEVNHTEILRFPKEAPISKKQLKKIQRKQRKMKLKITGGENALNQTESVGAGPGVMDTDNVVVEPTEGSDMDTFHPVKCSICTTEVGVYDSDEVYHFFNILASHA